MYIILNHITDDEIRSRERKKIQLSISRNRSTKEIISSKYTILFTHYINYTDFEIKKIGYGARLTSQYFSKKKKLKVENSNALHRRTNYKFRKANSLKAIKFYKKNTVSAKS